jgi:ABC-type glycerol-3-phosphate transport system substrate-binding protein
MAIVLLFLLGTGMVTQAQSSDIVLTLAVPEFWQDFFTPEMLAQFEAENPGTRVKLVSGNLPFFTPANADLEGHLTAIEEYVSAADVQYITTEGLSIEATRAGYFLDLSPLANADAALNADDFVPVIWESVQWDGGIWMLPVSADVITLIYDKTAFDEAGLAYPTDRWTLDDLANAARTLAVKDTAGNITSPGLIFLGNHQGLLLRSLLREGLYDNSVTLKMPAFDNTALDSLLTQLAELQTEGIISSEFSGPLEEMPLRISGSFGLAALNPDQPAPGSALLPGGSAGLEAQGFAISSGTRYPEQAYALAKFLTTRPEVTNNFFGATPARVSLRGVEAPPPEGGAVFIGGPNSPEAQAAIELALNSALPVAETHFTNYLTQALSAMQSEGLDARSALNEAEASAVTNLQTAAERSATTTVIVATPPPDVVLSEGEVSLKFGLTMFVTPLPNRDQWDAVIQEFVASDPQVGNIELDAGFTQPDQSAEQFDCFYLPLNYVPEVDLNTILSLDPFLDADTSFDKSDVVGGVLAQLQRDNKTWALPIIIQPEALRYDSERFNRAGIPAPEHGWTIEAFAEALRALKPNPEDRKPFASQSPGNTYLLILIAAYGGLPYDYRTDPVTINFTDPATVEAIRQALNLAKDGYIDYQELGGGREFIIVASGGPEDRAPIFTQSFGGFGFNVEITVGGPSSDPYRYTTYPVGNQFSAVTYSMGTAYISASTPNPEACYRWISTVARHPELFSAMPARRSLLNDPAVTAEQTPDETAFYNRFDVLLQDPATLALPSAFSGASPASFLLQRWLNNAFDSYVLRDGDLETELATAETYTKGFLECIALIPPYDPAVQDQLSYIGQYFDCATQVDPSFVSPLPVPQ